MESRATRAEKRRRGRKTRSQMGQSVFPGVKQTVVTVSQDRRPSPDGCSHEVLNSSDMISPHFSDYVQKFLFLPLLPRKKSVIAHKLEFFFFFFFFFPEGPPLTVPTLCAAA